MELDSDSSAFEEDQLTKESTSDHPVDHRTMKICNFINKIGMTPKSFLQNLLDSNKPAIIKRRQFFGSANGWPSTLKVIESLKSLVFKHWKSRNVNNWNDFILKEVCLDTYGCN